MKVKTENILSMTLSRLPGVELKIVNLLFIEFGAVNLVGVFSDSARLNVLIDSYLCLFDVSKSSDFFKFGTFKKVGGLERSNLQCFGKLPHHSNIHNYGGLAVFCFHTEVLINPFSPKNFPCRKS